MRPWLITAFLFFFITVTKAQSILKGRIEDGMSKRVASANITYRAIGGSAVLGYVLSKDDGSFVLNVKNFAYDSLEITFSHLSYIKKTIRIPNKSADYFIKLEDNTKTLDEIKISSPPIFKAGDTVSYNVLEFTSKQDRVIADVIKKLPGVEMQGNLILYQGKPIQKYMVNNLDLMGSRYGMINNNLPAEAVKSVQIIENDQPIKILKSLIPSDRASLNIQLKKFTTTGSGKIGFGYKPAMWDVNLTPMTFNKSFQMLNSFQTNNSGNDVASQLGTLSLGNGSGILDSSDPTRDQSQSYFNLADVSSPDFDQRKWLDNRIFLYSSNMLKKLENGLEIKTNLSYYNNLNKRDGYSSTSIFTPENKINYIETTSNRYKTNDLNAGLTINKNEDNIYLNNTLKLNRRWNDDIGNLVLNGNQPILQNNNFDDFGILNKFSLAKFLGKQLITINSLIDYATSPQSLYISPGRFEDIFNSGIPFNALTQQIHSSSFKNQNSISLTHAFQKLVISPEVGFNYQHNKLGSQILTEVEKSLQQLGNAYVNDLDTKQATFYLNMTSNYDIARFKFKFSTPYSLNVFSVSQLDNVIINNQVRNTFGPSLSVRYMLSPKTDLDITGSYSNQFGGLSNFNSAYILSSYRDIQKYNGKLQESKNLGSGISLSYKNTVKSQFASISYYYSHGKRDYIYRTEIDANGLATVELDDRTSEQNSHSVSARASTYFLDIKTVLKINANVQFSQNDYLLNDFFTKQNGLFFGAGFELNNNSSELLTFRYATNLNTSISKLKGQYENNILTNNHVFEINFYPVERHSISLANSYYITNIKSQKNQLFIDLDYRWAIPKWKIDIESNLINLLNNNSYIQQYNTEYSVVESYFQLRPRRFMISTKFKF